MAIRKTKGCDFSNNDQITKYGQKLRNKSSGLLEAAI